MHIIRHRIKYFITYNNLQITDMKTLLQGYAFEWSNELMPLRLLDHRNVDPRSP